ncbi:MAG TPA: enoyl-CoA hydratase/isomerase family protein [Trinickia sp.]|uniref:enoyl-CoA hydratase/isomerase family protein n=1 Tax=Trinickia sp. TaxID=2571163 RepID=UPI002CDFB4FF|nr:enoyl-CoA hydratase/isomerase family protein [Trinickia sp.]HTI19075.1 enoyl-CoA hydratase/isomerase family protein [Trinickia sp.]
MAMSEPGSIACDELRTFVDNRIGFVELNRPQALNALTLPMIRVMHAALDAWRADAGILAIVVYSPHPRGLSAGGDLRHLYDLSLRADVSAREQFFIEEYTLDYAIFTYPKPYIALMNGIVMGGGMGISLGAHRTGGLRVVTTSTQMAMPETRIGFFPDVGASWFLARTPGAIGQYLAVTGATIRAADALYAGLADVCIDEAALPALLERLRSEPFADGADVVDCIARAAATAPCDAARDPQCSSLAAARAWIDRHFGQRDVAHILASLEAERADGARDWAEEIVATLRERSPLAMAVSLDVVARAEGSMAECLRRDLDLTRSMFEFGDVVEGVRARIVDKDDHPQWRIARIEDVRSLDVDRMFVRPWSVETHPLRHLHG